MVFVLLLHEALSKFPDYRVLGKIVKEWYAIENERKLNHTHTSQMSDIWWIPYFLGIKVVVVSQTPKLTLIPTPHPQTLPTKHPRQIHVVHLSLQFKEHMYIYYLMLVFKFKLVLFCKYGRLIDLNFNGHISWHILTEKYMKHSKLHKSLSVANRILDWLFPSYTLRAAWIKHYENCQYLEKHVSHSVFLSASHCHIHPAFPVPWCKPTAAPASYQAIFLTLSYL